MKEWAKRLYAKLERYPRIRTAIGIGLLVLAVIGSLLPILQGWMFFAAAIGVLGMEHPIIRWCFRQLEWLRPVLDWLRARWQGFRRLLDRLGIWKFKDLRPGGPPV
jgi:hypothetical protein